jgi:FKBP-type peptidyl-prolyl cis-trans isomerase
MKIKSGIRLISETEGAGQPVAKGDKVVVRMNGWLTKGECIHEEYIREVKIGQRGCAGLIAGIDYSLPGMREGGKRKVRISPHLAYRDEGFKNMPPNAVLIYEIEILRVISRAAGVSPKTGPADS